MVYCSVDNQNREYSKIQCTFEKFYLTFRLCRHNFHLALFSFVQTGVRSMLVVFFSGCAIFYSLYFYMFWCAPIYVPFASSSICSCATSKCNEIILFLDFFPSQYSTRQKLWHTFATYAILLWQIKRMCSSSVLSLSIKCVNEMKRALFQPLGEFKYETRKFKRSHNKWDRRKVRIFWMKIH